MDTSMAGRFVEVPAAAIRERLAGAGFVKEFDPDRRYTEEVYLRHHDRDGRYVLKVYSSISLRRDVARGCGADAIRVVALLVTPNRTYPIFKAARVYRTGSVEKVLDRMIERAREAYAACNEHRRQHVRKSV